MMFGFGFDLFSIIFTIMFLLVATLIVVTLVQSIRQWNRNNHSPRLNVEATVVAKRHHRSSHGTGADRRTSNSYYVTFEFASGDRMELQLHGHEFGLLVEGDRGELEFQGTRYLAFRRKGTGE